MNVNCLLRISPRFLQSAGLIIAVVCISGCASLPSLQRQAESIPENVGSTQELYRVEMQRDFQEPLMYTDEIDSESTVQTALERSGAIKKYRDMEIMILRVVKETGRGLRMPVNYVPRKKSVSPEQNYAIHPGDRILVKPKSSNVLDKIVDSFSK
jgi:hypothetical protein